MVEALFDYTTGIAGLVSWLGAASDGWFFMMAIGVLFLITFVPSMMKWGTDWPLLSSSFGCLLFSIPIYYMQGFGVGVDADMKMFVWILLFVLAIVKVAVFKDD